jgi:hypothetical protein
MSPQIKITGKKKNVMNPLCLINTPQKFQYRKSDTLFIFIKAIVNKHPKNKPQIATGLHFVNSKDISPRFPFSLKLVNICSVFGKQTAMKKSEMIIRTCLIERIEVSAT